MNNIYLSVVLPVFNNEDVVGDAIQSVLNQTYPYFELIVVDDGSTDNSAKIINSFKDNRIRYIYKNNTGLADTLNIGIDQAKYDWIARMDGDDICFPNRFEKQVACISDGIDIIGSNAEYFNETSILFVSKMPLTTSGIISLIRKGRVGFIHPTVIIRKSLLIKIGGYDTNFKRGEDHNLWTRVLCSDAKALINIKEPLLHYRYYQKSRNTTIDQHVNVMLNICLSNSNNYKPLSIEGYHLLREKVESTISCRVAKYLSQFQFTPILKYVSIIWWRTGIVDWQMRKLFKKHFKADLLVDSCLHISYENIIKE